MADNAKDAAKKLAEQKAKNTTERIQRRLEGNDSKKTRDGGTTRRVWRDR